MSNQGKLIAARQARGGPGHLQLTRHSALCAAGDRMVVLRGQAGLVSRLQPKARTSGQVCGLVSRVAWRPRQQRQPRGGGGGGGTARATSLPFRWLH